ncbi:MAG: GDP-mannose 4,6-dehydratase [Chlamydiia bacterium]|nr:GDP-mannose 4,6-dehydratase [Chlamydiia bacterium]
MTNVKRILVTGAAGFIGYHTALALKDHHVVGYDNFDPYYSVELKKERARRLKEAGIEVINADINDKHTLFQLMEKERFTHIIHLAAQAGVRYSLKAPEAYIRSNIDGFLSVLELVRKYPETKLVYASSSSVYGLNEKIPYSIHDRTDSQASLYGVTKKSNELMAQTYHHLFDADCVGLRFFTVYGPWGRPDMAYFSFSQAIMEGKAIELYNFGNCMRDFTYIDDIVAGILGALDLDRGNRVFNLGNHEPVTLMEFVETLEVVIGKKAEKRLLPMQPGDVTQTFADIKESSEALNFYPKTSLKEGLSHFVKWGKEYCVLTGFSK